jgi:hypothetical protein
MPKNPTGSWPGRPPTSPLCASIAFVVRLVPVLIGMLKARDAARREESLRVIAYYKERDRQREERENAEARAENDRQKERLRQQGWPI